MLKGTQAVSFIMIFSKKEKEGGSVRFEKEVSIFAKNAILKRF